MLKKILFSFIPIVLLSNEYQSTLQDEIEWLEEESFVVSASRVKEDIKKTPASIKVISSEEIEKMGADNILDVLKIVSGVSITQSNIFYSAIEIRGIKDFTSKQVLFMIDGHAIDAALLNGGSVSTFDNLNLEDIKKIEIIKGPASALYGANAFTGLINIITKKSTDINGVEVRAKVGSYNSKEASLLYGEKIDDLSIVANLNVKDTDGDSVHIYQDAAGNSGDTNPFLKQLRGSLKLDYEDYYLSSMVLTRKDGSHYGPLGELSDENRPTTDYFYIEAGIRKKLNEKFSFSSRVYFDRYTFDNYWHLPQYSNLRTTNGLRNDKKGIEVLGTYKLTSKFTTILGSNLEEHKQHDVVTILNGVDVSNTSSTFSPNIDRNLRALYINNLYDLNDDIRLTLGLRHDDYSSYGSNTAPRGGFSWQINNNNILKLMYGEGFRIPTFAELSNNSSYVITGNNNLTPEKVETFEVTFENEYNNLDSKITYFNNTFHDLISLSGTNYVNSGKIKTNGLELESKLNLRRGSSLTLNYTYLQAKDEITNLDLENVSKHKANMIFDYRYNKYLNFYNHLLIKDSAKRASGDNRADVAGYSIFSTSVKIKNIYKDAEFKLAINNLFDKKAYDPSDDGQTEDDYEIKGRNFYIESKFKF